MSGVRAGDIIAGKFQVERILGEGGMGYVVAARHLQLGQTVALKFMRDDVCRGEYRHRFLREARNTVRLKSKHVSRVLDVGALNEGTPYMVMEYLEGSDLSALLHQRGSFPPEEACEYVIQACEAIAEAHGHGIVHRDLKPANLFLTRGPGGEPVVKVLDFGVSKIVELGLLDGSDSSDSARGQDSVVTKVSDILGSPSYMAPEQLASARAADTKSDVWSLGVILFRFISGKAPFKGSSLGELIQRIIHDPIPNLCDVQPDVPEGLEDVVRRCMERERKLRPDVIELARLLAPYAGVNAAPSLERLAILGPALFADLSVPRSPAASRGRVPRRSSSRVTSSPSRRPKRDMSTWSFLGWSLLLVAVIGSIVVIGVKLLGPGRFAVNRRPMRPMGVHVSASEPTAAVVAVVSSPVAPDKTSSSPRTVASAGASEPTSDASAEAVPIEASSLFESARRGESAPSPPSSVLGTTPGFATAPSPAEGDIPSVRE